MYSAQITRQHKAAFVILLDRSGSMAEEVTFEGRRTTKAEALAEVVNALIEEIICRSHRERYVGNYFDIAIIGYSGERAESLLGSGFRSIVDVNSMNVPIFYKPICRTLPSGEKLHSVVERHRWIEPKAEGLTPMGDALRMARRMVRSWCKKHPDSFPPIVINITDGEATDSSHEEICALAESIRACATNDGGTLLMNIHIAEGDHTTAPSLTFPCEGDRLPSNRHSQLLYDISSTLPEFYNTMFSGDNSTLHRAVCYNASLSELVGLLAIGTLSMEQMI